MFMPRAAGRGAGNLSPSSRMRGRCSPVSRGGRIALGAVTLILAAAFFAPAAGAQPLPVGCQRVVFVSFGQVIYCPRVSYHIQTVNDNADPTFNQLLGINVGGVIAGYFGSGVPVGNQGHPNQGYLVFPPYVQNYFANNNYPGSVQTQVTGINDLGVMAGFYSTMNNANNQGNDNHGWYKVNGQYHQADFPTTNPASPPVDQLLGVNDHNVAVGFFMDKNGVNHGYTYVISTGQAREVTVNGFTNITAAAINNQGDIAGFGNPVVNGTASQAVEGFLRLNGGKVYTINFPRSSATSALGVNNNDEVVGTETFPGSTGGVTGHGGSPGMHGFTWQPHTGFKIVDDPHGMQNGVTTTTINGVNACGDLVGFYVDAAGNTDGMLANAQFSHLSFKTHFAPDLAASGARTSHRKRKPPTKIVSKLPKGC